MNKLGTARVLMAATILLIAGFQVYWIKKLYHEEDNNFRKTADVIFRDAMYKLQAERFTGDTLVFKGMPEDNLFMTDIISSINHGGKKDSMKQKMVISMSSTTEVSTLKKKVDKDTVVYINT
jgi:two-component system, OmpR family, phosphate regulon sensor histidine kinase PhoR